MHDKDENLWHENPTAFGQKSTSVANRFIFRSISPALRTTFKATPQRSVRVCAFINRSLKSRPPVAHPHKYRSPKHEYNTHSQHAHHHHAIIIHDRVTLYTFHPAPDGGGGGGGGLNIPNKTSHKSKYIGRESRRRRRTHAAT